MRLAIGSDEQTHVTDAVLAELRRRGHEIALDMTGSVDDAADPATRSWPVVALAVGQAVAGGAADEGILFCWTGTGVCIAANKVRGVRAALCDDAETARGARLWNNANVLCLSLRRTSEPMAKEILEAWFNTSFIPNEGDSARLALLAGFD